MDKQSKAKKIITGVVAVFILFLIIGAIGSGSKKDGEEKKDDNVSVQEEQKDDKQAIVDDLNTWFKDVYLNEEGNQLMVEGEYSSYGHKLRTINGFKYSEGFAGGLGDILVLAPYNTAKAERFTADDISGVATSALYAYASEKGIELEFANFNSSGRDVKKMRLDGIYVEWQ